ncbi:hypothetical protein [Leisingera sp. F5]|uniref:hypothetical protein n=1 Tax=Leisingera sp. F5 TaxID=1813816 RepID=UPI0025BF8D06|nr:hypothetical protein [Leisingera sp. F5]
MIRAKPQAAPNAWLNCRAGIGPAAPRKQPSGRARFAVIAAQQIQQDRRQHQVAILSALAPVNPDQHAAAAGITGLQMRDLAQRPQIHRLRLCSLLIRISSRNRRPSAGTC